MENKIIANKKANFLVFLGEISGVRENDWSEERKEEWIKKSGGKLNNNEKSQLQELHDIFNSVNYNLAEALFLSNNNTLVKKEFSKKQFEEITKSFDIFNKRFNNIWKEKERNFYKIEKIFSKKDAVFDEILNKIQIIYGVKIDLKKIPIQFLITSSNKEDLLGYFSATNKKIDIVLEYSNKITPKQETFIKLVIIHELSHLLINKNHSLKKIINKNAEKNKEKIRKIFDNMPAEKVLEELITSSFVPEGYLSKYYFKKPIKKILKYTDNKQQTNFTLLRQVCAYKMSKTTKKYFDKNKKIDEQYILKIIESI